MIVTYCYIDRGKPIVYERRVSKEDREALEATHPRSVVRWEEKRV